MAKFTKIPSDTFKKLQINAGIILSDFDPTAATFEASEQIGATSGGILFSATPSFSDFGSDVDNCPKNTKELKRIDDIEVKATGTFVTVDTAVAKSLMAAADVDKNQQIKVTPRRELAQTDFSDIWIVGDYSDQNGETGGFIAIHLLDALSTGGFQLRTADKAKGQMAFEYTAHYSILKQDTVPYEIYIKSGTAS